VGLCNAEPVMACVLGGHGPPGGSAGAGGALGVGPIRLSFAQAGHVQLPPYRGAAARFAVAGARAG
jgi:hypothetical protein